MTNPELPLVSICIPTYTVSCEVGFLDRLLRSIREQDYDNYEIIISDHSEDNIILEYLARDAIVNQEFSNMKIIYHSFTDKRGFAAANLNNAIYKSNGQIIKPMFQDDFFARSDAISLMVKVLMGNPHRWMGVGCLHTDEGETRTYNPHPPRWDPSVNMALGHNLIGSPSVTIFERECFEQHQLDEELLFLVDCEFYHRLGQTFGEPAMINDLLVTIRMRDSSVGATVSPELIEKEKQYVQAKHFLI